MPAAIRLLGRGEDLLAGGDGDDQLTGGFGPDAFVVTEPGNGFDRITDFATGLDGDRLAFAADVLEDFDPASSDLAAFFDLDGRADGTLFRVDRDGGGDDFVRVALLQGVSGVSVDDLVVHPDQGALAAAPAAPPLANRAPKLVDERRRSREGRP